MSQFDHYSDMEQMRDREGRDDDSPPDKPNYVQQGRNGHGCIDFYKGDVCVRLVMAGLTEKDSILLTGALNSAVEEGRTYESELLKWEAGQKTS